MYQMIADLINQRTGLSRDDIIIIIAENEEENWSFGRGKAQLVQ
jgi:malonate semialdehyde decarboxylase